MVIAMVALIIWGRVALPPILILLSTAAVIVLSVTGALPDVVGPLGILDALKGYIGTGANSVLNTVVLFTFAIVYFNILSDAGMFDVIVGAVMKRMGNSVSAILLMTCFLAFISHLDGSGATTMLITIPTMLPLYKKMRVSNVILLGYVGLWSGVENMLPWTSALARVSASTGVDPYELWNALLPVQIVGFIILIASCFVLGKILKARGCGMPDDEFNAIKSGMGKKDDPVLKVSNTVLYIDMIMTVVMVVAMLLGWLNTNVAFMIFLSFALLLNCHGSKEMTAQIKKHGATALNMVMILFSIGMLVGVMKDTGMMNAMTETLISFVPEAMGSHLTFIIALLSVPLSMAVGSDSLYMIMAPIFGNMAVAFGGTTMHAAGACVIGACIAANLCLVAPTPYLALGLAEVEMKDNLKYLFIPTWILGIVLAIVGAIVGVFPF
ncbi:SLC13 family permease [uncultured Intestinimonas sp.]|uniref:SLC13 family permease n=1 Tax=uncultured Intestinimonas sp. TaxID=1689265 RepID=UPI0025DAC924|nr:SLC13 family permease [uncultured Intestinimonas sp.]